MASSAPIRVLKLIFFYLKKRIVVSSTPESTYYMQNIWQDDPEGDCWLLAPRSEYSYKSIYQEMDPCAQLPKNRHTTSKICGKMTHNGTAGYTSVPVRLLEYLLWPQKWIPRAKFPINRHTTCNKSTKMPHNVMAGYQHAGQNAPMSILTSEMNSLSQFCYYCCYSNLSQTHKYSKIFSFIERARTFKP